MLDTIMKVTPPLYVINCVIDSIMPISKMEPSGNILPPFNAKFIELNKPPITKKNRNILIIPRLIGLLDSDGFITRSVIFNP
jgi:hypothetical protein